MPRAIQSGLVVLLLGLSALASDFTARQRLAVLDLVTELDRHAIWCDRKGGLDLERDRACVLILAFDPDHKQARKFLGYRKDKRGRWERRKVYIEPTNRNRKRESEAVERGEEIRASFVHAASTIWEIAGGASTSAERQRLFRDVLRVDPDCRWAHERNDEVFRDDRWYLRESPIAHQRNQEIAAAARRAHAEGKTPVRAEVKQHERAIELEWTDAYMGRTWRVAGTVPVGELELMVRVAEAAPAVFDAGLGKGAHPGGERIIYLFSRDSEATALLAAQSGIDEVERKRLAAIDEPSFWMVPGKVLVVCAGTPDQRAAATVMALYRTSLQARFGIDRNQGWLWHGVPAYLCYQLTGVRQIAPDARSGNEQEAQWIDDLNKPGSNWRGITSRLLESRNAPALDDVTGRAVDQLDARGLLVSYALAAYVIEAHPQRVGTILNDLGKGRSADEVLRQHLGMDLEALAIRLPRWLDEIR